MREGGRRENTLKYGNKTVYVTDMALWERAKEIAGLMGENISTVILDALRVYVSKHADDADSIKALRDKLGGKS